MAKKFGASTFRGKLHTTTAEKFHALVSDLESSDKLLDSPTSKKLAAQKPSMQLTLSFEDIDGLPPELVKELSFSDNDKTEITIANIIEEAGGIISLDKLLIALYKKTGEIHKRSSLYSKLSRMANKELIHYVPGKKGVYSTEQLKAEDVALLFGPSRADDRSVADDLI